MKEGIILKTPCQQEREARDLAIYKDYHNIMAVEGQSKLMAHEYLCRKYGIHSQGTIYTILKRVEKRLQKHS